MSWQWKAGSERTPLTIQTPQEVTDEYRKRYDEMSNQNPKDMAKTSANIPPEDLVMAILARPGNYDACLLGLAHAYEARGERIADLEEDVERLRPREIFSPETLFEHDGLCIETECRGGLSIATRDDDEQPWHVVLDLAKSSQCIKALATWAGVDGVEWMDVRDFCGPAGLVCLLTDGEHVRSGSIEFAGSFRWPFDTTPTHWAPLPKPPEST